MDKTTTDRTKNLVVWWKWNFNANNQPTPEQKRLWWERKRQAQALMDKILWLQDLTMEELQEILDKKSPEALARLWKMTVQDVICLKYVQEVMKWKLIVDFMNRHIAYAPQDLNLWASEWISEIQISIKRNNHAPEWQNEEN